MDILKKFFKKNKNKYLISTKENTSIRSSAEIVNIVKNQKIFLSEIIQL